MSFIIQNNTSFQNMFGQAPTHLAVRINNVMAVKKRLMKGAAINAKDGKGQTPLYIVTHKDVALIMDFLLKHSACPNIQDINRFTPLHIATMKISSELFDKLINNGADIGLQDNKSMIPLHHAGEHGFVDIIIMDNLLTKESNQNVQDMYGMSSLHFVSLLPKISVKNPCFVIEKPLNVGADVNTKDKKNRSPLHIVTLHNHFPNVCRLLENRADINSQDSKGHTPLHYAVNLNFMAIMDKLLSQGADTDVRSRRGTTCLHIATLKEQLVVVEKLLHKSADVNVRNFKDQTPLLIACQTTNREMVFKLLQYGPRLEDKDNSGCTSLHHAAKSGLWDVVESLLKHGAQVNVTNKKGQTPLHMTVLAYKRDLRIIDYWKTFYALVLNGADVNVKDVRGESAIYYALQYNYDEITYWLYRKGALVNCKNVDGTSPLHVAALGSWSLFDFLLLAGGNPSTKDNEGITPLHILLWNHLNIDRRKSENGSNNCWNIELIINLCNAKNVKPLELAISMHYVYLADLLVREGANINTVDKLGCTVLHQAVMADSEFIEVYIERGVNINARNKKGQTALHLAVLRNIVRIVELLLNRGAEVNCTDNKGRTPLELACKNFTNPHLVQQLLDNKARFKNASKIVIFNSFCNTIICDFYTNHQLRMAAAKLEPELKVIDEGSPLASNFQIYLRACEKEVHKLKATRFGNHSLYDVFSKSSDPAYVCDTALEEGLKCMKLKSEFPIYNALLRVYFECGKKRFVLLNSAQELFSFTSTTPFQVSLPIEVRMMILTYLSEVDLKSVTKLISILR